MTVLDHPLSVDPLIAEAKQRARRRRLAALLLLLLAGGAAGTLYFSRPNGTGGGGKPAALTSGISVPPVVGRGFIQSAPASALASHTLVSMSFPTARVGYLVTGDGRLLRSSDEGRTWSHVALLGRIKDVWKPPQLDFVTARIGFALTPAGRLLGTTDGGQRWHSLSRLHSIETLDFVDRNDGWVSLSSHSDSAAAIYRTTDGGLSWTRVGSPACFGYVPLSFFSTSSGVAVCSGEPGAGQAAKTLYATSDGGSTWREIGGSHAAGLGKGLPDVPTMGYASGLIFRGRSVGIMSADRLGLYLTRNGAKKWSVPLLTDDQWFISAISWPSSRIAYALIGGGTGNAALLRSTDGTRHWQRIYPTGPGEPDSTVAALSPRVVVGAGTTVFGVRNGAVIRTTNGARTWTTPGALPGGVDQIVRGAGGLWAIADHVFRSSDAGKTWTQVQTPAGAGHVQWLDATTFGSVYLLTESGALYRTDDNGASWNLVRKRGGLELGSVQFVSPQVGFAISYRIDLSWSLLQTIDGGRSWKIVHTPGLEVRDFYALDAGHWWLWGFGSCHVHVILPASKFHRAKRGCTGRVQRLLLRTADAGAHWTAFRMGGGFTSPGYSFATPRIGYAIDDNGLGWDGILRTTDGGQTWRWFSSDAFAVAAPAHR